ncbi:MAG TPA: acyl-CoA dehydrogenase, partial [Rhodospirillaceae bacterium]|nr:acyl-CoA dehydrogenase [Rhodospirillaceae bacterium]
MALDADTFRQITETIDRFVRDRLIPAEAQVDEDNAIPTDIISEMRDLGLFGLSIPEEYGGLGLTMSEEVELTFRLGRASPA